MSGLVVHQEPKPQDGTLRASLQVLTIPSGSLTLAPCWCSLACGGCFVVLVHSCLLITLCSTRAFSAELTSAVWPQPVLLQSITEVQLCTGFRLTNVMSFPSANFSRLYSLMNISPAFQHVDCCSLPSNTLTAAPHSVSCPNRHRWSNPSWTSLRKALNSTDPTASL